MNKGLLIEILIAILVVNMLVIGITMVTQDDETPSIIKELKELKKDYEDCEVQDGGEFCCNYEYDDNKLKEKDCRFFDEEVLNAKEEYGDTNYIQGSHNKIYYSTSNGLKVSYVDYCKRMTGSSMQPTIFTGNRVCFIDYKESMEDDLKEGMLVHYITEDDGAGTTHRIKAIYKEYFIAQGDNNNGYEEVDYEQIKGVGVAILLT